MNDLQDQIRNYCEKENQLGKQMYMEDTDLNDVMNCLTKAVPDVIHNLCSRTAILKCKMSDVQEKTFLTGFMQLLARKMLQKSSGWPRSGLD